VAEERVIQDQNPDSLAALEQALVASQYFPEATYRVQFHAGFTFQDALQIVPYLHDLGITHLYASPLLQARPGSTHGYDTTNHQAFNPELGTAEDYEELCQVLQLHGMGQVLDIVPNHMGVAGNDNQWWRDVLENGPASPYSGFFDIAWYASPRVEMHERLLLPSLGKAYGEALESQEIQLQYASGAFTIHYFDHFLPVALSWARPPSHWQSTTAFSPPFVTCRCAARLTQLE
jgi:(1->4)-alpha-D-glucan 1-alpha-D-glucosylmutase